jgi:hypothetical protein
LSKFLIILGLLLIPSIAYANVVWPALYLETRLFSWWAISVGLLVEYLFIRRVFGLSPKKALLADVIANVVSAVAGIFLIPVAGILWEIWVFVIVAEQVLSQPV